MMSNIPDTPYSVKSKLGLQSYNFVQPSTYIPTVDQKDYDNGYITRYFIGRINYFQVTETNAKDYNIANPAYFAKSKIKWKITGPEFNVYNKKTLETTGVVDYNILRINEAAQYIKNIEVVLNNPRQFWRGF